MWTSNLFVTKKKSMLAFKIRTLLLSLKKLSPYRKVSVICKSFLKWKRNHHVPINVSYSIQEGWSFIGIMKTVNK